MEQADTEALAQLTDLSPEDLDTLADNLRAGYEAIAEDRTPEALTEAEAIADALDAVATERTRRETEAAKAEAKAAEIAKRVNPPDEEPDTEPVPEPAPTPVPEPAPEAKAAAIARPPLARVRARLPEITKPAATGRASLSLVAEANLAGVAMGEEMDRDALAQAFTHRINSTLGASWAGGQLKDTLSRARYSLGDDRRVSDDAEASTRTVTALISERKRALSSVLNTSAPMAGRVAAGGLCAPVRPIYDMFTMGTNDEPVADSLVSVDGGRGGVTFIIGPTLSSVTSAVTTITEAQDDTGGYTKPKLTVDCDTLVTCKVNMVTAVVQFGNLGARAFPEQVAANLAMVEVAHARESENRLLASISAGSIAGTANYGTTGIGAAREFGATLRLAAWGVRSRNRLAINDPLEALLPYSLLEMWAADIAMEAPGRYSDPQAVAISEIENAFRAARVVPTWYIDSATGGTSQIAGAQSNGALNLFPATIVWWLFAPGTWLFVDGGELNLGVVRDSTLNNTNNYQVFRETFEIACKFGTESLQITSTICASGGSVGTVTAICMA